ncbi:MAG: M48 family metalloprotease [Myxococcales bacterium]|nr:M48 family metalloprotease [Deltaproteobacteria bacterium]NND27272.1 M48 family metalloprotease [Myxococcales bacterium]NNL25447.1 M48 family metalloprotease [Myxococcales bacterium]
MKKILLVVCILSFAVGAQADFGRKFLKKDNVTAAQNAVKAATLSDEDMAKLSREAVASMDEQNPVVPDGDLLAKRFDDIVKGLESEDGLALNFKLYNVSDVNAFATPDGSIRVMAGLMIIMTDDEVRSVIGHEIGHVKLQHAKKQYQKAYSVAAGKDAAGANSGSAGKVLADSQLGAFLEDVMNAKFSRNDESASDEYGFNFMVKHGFDYHAMEGAFSKLAELSGESGKKSLKATHPGAAERARIAKERANAQDKKMKQARR